MKDGVYNSLSSAEAVLNGCYSTMESYDGYAFNYFHVLNVTSGMGVSLKANDVNLTTMKILPSDVNMTNAYNAMYKTIMVANDIIDGMKSSTIEQGVEAQYQHLYAYGCTDTLPEGTVIYDPRYELVTRGKAETWEELTGKWAVPGYDTSKFSSLEEAIKVSTIEEPEVYGHKILNIANRLNNIEVTQEEIDDFYGVEEEPDPVDPTPVEPDEPDTPVDPVEPETDNWFIVFLKMLVNVIVDFVKGLFKK